MSLHFIFRKENMFIYKQKYNSSVYTWQQSEAVDTITNKAEDLVKLYDQLDLKNERLVVLNKKTRKYGTQDATDIVKEWMFLNDNEEDRVVASHFGINNLTLNVSKTDLRVFSYVSEYLGYKKIADIKNLPAFLLILEENPRFGGVSALDLLLTK